MEDANEGTDKVVGVGVGAEIAAGDGALDGGYEGGVDERTGAFDEAHGATGDGVHRRDDEHFSGDVVDEEQHPGAQGFERRHRCCKALRSGGKFLNFAAIDGFDEGVARWKVPVQCPGTNLSPARNVVKARRRAIPREGLFGDFKDALAIMLRIGAEFACRRSGWELLLRHSNNSQNILQPETSSGYLLFGHCLRFIQRRPVCQSGAMQIVPLNSRREAMHVFVTGSTGFIGTELVKELIAAGHQVRGLTRSDAGVEQLKAAGAEVYRGDLTDLNSLRLGAMGMDAVVNLAFNHDWAKFEQNAKDEVQAIDALGSVLEPGKLLVVTSGIGITSGAPGQVRKETDSPTDSPTIPRKPEQAAQAVAAKVCMWR